MHEKLKELAGKIWLEMAEPKVAGLGAVACRKTSKESSLSAKDEQERAFNRRSELREYRFSVWMGVHTSSFDDV